jgi:hypothetical protein
LVVLLMVYRSISDRSIASGQEAAARSTVLSEAGIANRLAELNHLPNHLLLRKTYDPLDPATGRNFLGTYGLPEGEGDSSREVNEWSDTPVTNGCPTDMIEKLTQEADLGAGQAGRYQIRAYRYVDPDRAVTGDELAAVIVEGTEGTAAARIQVDVPIAKEAIDSTFPGLYARKSLRLGNGFQLLRESDPEITTGNNANVICQDCELPRSTCEDVETPIVEADIEESFGLDDTGQIEGTAAILNPDLPASVLTPPTTACSAASGPDCLIRIPVITDNHTTLPQQADISQRDAWMDAKGAWDKERDKDQPFHYQVPSIRLPRGKKLTIVSGRQVLLYVEGEINLSGDKPIETLSSKALQIYGSASDTSSQTIQITGVETTLNAVIYAPNAAMTLTSAAGPTSGDPTFNGFIWVGEWDSSGSSSPVKIKISDQLPNELGEPFASLMFRDRLRPQIKWKRLPVATEPESP